MTDEPEQGPPRTTWANVATHVALLGVFSYLITVDTGFIGAMRPLNAIAMVVLIWFLIRDLIRVIQKR